MNDRRSALKWLIVPVIFGLYFVARKTNDGPVEPLDDDDDHAPAPTATIAKNATPLPPPTPGKASNALAKNVPVPKTSGTASAPAGKVAPGGAMNTGGAKPGAAIKGNKMQTLQGGLKVEDERVGTGKEAKPGDHVTVNYRGMLENGTVFDESYKRGQPFDFTLGQGSVIRGWDVGVAGMKEGGKRKLMIPSEMGYGARGAGADIPPNANLIFDVELLKVG